MKLPIRLVPRTSPPQFEWEQRVSTMDESGFTIQRHRGCVSSGLEDALVKLVKVADKLLAENEQLKADIEKLKQPSSQPLNNHGHPVQPQKARSK